VQPKLKKPLIAEQILVLRGARWNQLRFWGCGYGGFGVVGFVNRGGGAYRNSKIRSPFEQNSDPVADGWYQLRFGGYTRDGVRRSWLERRVLIGAIWVGLSEVSTTLL